MGRGIFSMRKLIEGNLKPFGFMKVSHTSKVVVGSFSPLKSCLPTLCNVQCAMCMCKTEMYFRAMLWFVFLFYKTCACVKLTAKNKRLLRCSSGRCSGLFGPQLALKQTRSCCCRERQGILQAFNCTLSIFVILVESDKYWIRKKCKYQSDDETSRFVQDFQGKISFVTRRFCFLRTQSWKRQLLWKS